MGSESGTGICGQVPLPPPSRTDTTEVGPGRSLVARLADPYPLLPGSSDRGTHRHRKGLIAGGTIRLLWTIGGPPTYTRRCRHFRAFGTGAQDHPIVDRVFTEGQRPSMKRGREDNGARPEVGLGGPAYLPPLGMIVGRAGEYALGPSLLSVTTTSL